MPRSITPIHLKCLWCAHKRLLLKLAAELVAAKSTAKSDMSWAHCPAEVSKQAAHISDLRTSQNHSFCRVHVRPLSQACAEKGLSAQALPEHLPPFPPH